MLQDVIRQTIEEIIPKNVSLNFWDLEIDLMANYQNYFSQDNAARMDNLTLKNKTQYQTFQNK